MVILVVDLLNTYSLFVHTQNCMYNGFFPNVKRWHGASNPIEITEHNSAPPDIVSTHRLPSLADGGGFCEPGDCFE